MLVSVTSRGNSKPLYVKVLKDETIYDKEGNEVGELFFSKDSKGNNAWGLWNKETAPTKPYVPNDIRLRRELGIE